MHVCGPASGHMRKPAAGAFFTGPFRTAEVSVRLVSGVGEERATAHCSPAHQQHRRHAPVLDLINGSVDKPPLDLHTARTQQQAHSCEPASLAVCRGCS